MNLLPILEPAIGQWRGKVGLEVLESGGRVRDEEEEAGGRWSRTTWPEEAETSKDLVAEE